LSKKCTMSDLDDSFSPGVSSLLTPHPPPASNLLYPLFIKFCFQFWASQWARRSWQESNYQIFWTNWKPAAGSFSGRVARWLYFQTQNRNLGTLSRVLQWKMLVYFMDIWSILSPLDIFYGHMVYMVVIWYNFPRFGMLHQEKSGNPVLESLILEIVCAKLCTNLCHLNVSERRRHTYIQYKTRVSWSQFVPWRQGDKMLSVKHCHTASKNRTKCPIHLLSNWTHGLFCGISVQRLGSLELFK
jgi:hypothetical protein